MTAARRRVAAVAALLLLLAGLWAILGPGLRRRGPTLPPLGAPPAAVTVGFAEFVGSEACADCHPGQYGVWRRSTHGQAGGAPGEIPVVAPFDGRAIRFRDAVVTPMRAAGGEYRFRVAQRGRPEQVFQVAGVVGGGHMVGGGTQGFLAAGPDGTLRFLPFDYAVAQRTWFCNTGGRSERGWVPITETLALAECGDWPPSRVLGSHDRFQNCQQCHGSQITVRFDAEARRYDTRFVSLSVNCESCHGPGRRHVELVASGGRSADVGMEALATLGKDDALEVCFRCHAVKEQLAAGYLPGLPFREYFSTKVPLLGEAPLFPDGRVRTFAYQENHLASDCYRNGSMTCTDCHDPHAQTYRDVAGRSLESRFDDGQCLGCHPSKADPLSRHTGHRPDSPGSRCVACHMPYLQQPAVGPGIRYARSDHTVGIPRPAFDAELGIVGACRQCHPGLSPPVLQAQVEARYGSLKPLAPAIAALVRAQSVENLDSVAALVLVDRPTDPLGTFVGLSHFFVRYLAPEIAGLPRAVVDRLAAAARSGDDDVAALALASLHLARGQDERARRRLTERLKALGPRERAVRRRWVAVLDRRAEAYRVSREPVLAAATYRRALEVAPDDPAVHLNLGIALADAGAYDSAAVHYRRALELDPAQPLALVSLAFALLEQGEVERAFAAYRDAAAINPWEPVVYLSLGNALLRQRLLAEAVPAFERAVALDPALAPAHFGRAAALARLGRRDEAIGAARRGLEFDPGNAAAMELLRRLEAGPSER